MQEKLPFYLIPGLGADERVFRGLSLPGEVHVVKWLPPTSANEPLAAYAERLAAAVPADRACWLVGVSFGGILAQEVARHRPRARVVLISSITNSAELPGLARLARATGLHRLLLSYLPWVAKWLFSIKSDEHYDLLRRILADTDPTFTRWAIQQLGHWQGGGAASALRIHGSADRLLPVGRAEIDYWLPGAGHFLIVTHATEVSQLLIAHF